MTQPPDTNLTDKFTALQLQLATQHAALLAKLDDVAASLSPDSITAAITALRGTGPENTIRSLNQSVWALAGPAPGKTLTDLAAAIAELRGSGPENTIRSLNQSVWNLAGPTPGKTLTDLATAIAELRGSGPAPGKTLTDLATAIEAVSGGRSLNEIYHQWMIADYETSNGAYLTSIWSNIGELLSVLSAVNVAVGGSPDDSLTLSSVRGLLDRINTATQSNQSAQAALLACCELGNRDQLRDLPVGSCAAPFVSDGIIRIAISANFVEPTVVATWSETVPATHPGITTLPGGLATGQTQIQCDDWAQYRIYVASEAAMFGLYLFNLQKFTTNQWITLSGSGTFEFQASDNLKVYICPVGSEPMGACPGASSDPLTPNTWAESVQTIPLRHTFDATGATGGSTWSLEAPIRIENLDPLVAGFVVSRSGVTQLCIAWTSNEPTLQELGVRVFNEASGTFGEVAATVAPVSISMSGSSGALTLPINMQGYELEEYVFVPYLAYSDVHSGFHDVTVQITIIEP
jgi:hypothetical protein